MKNKRMNKWIALILAGIILLLTYLTNNYNMTFFDFVLLSGLLYLILEHGL